MLLHATECRERAPPGLGGVDAELADETLRFHRDVELELRIDSLFSRPSGEDQPDARKQSLHPAQNTHPSDDPSKFAWLSLAVNRSQGAHRQGRQENTIDRKWPQGLTLATAGDP